jgi:DNA primase
MAHLSYEDLTEIVDNPKLDGRRRNVVCDCAYCGKSQKMGISLVKESNPWQCFSCGERGTAWKLCNNAGRLDLIQEFFDVDEDVENPLLQIEEEELDLELEEVELPPQTKRVLQDAYLDKRGWWEESYMDFPVYKSKNFKYADYVLLGVKMYGELVGFVGRHIWSKSKIANYNSEAKRKGDYQILRYRNSEGNEFAKMLGGFDKIVEGETDTVILVEGFMDVINISQELDLFASKDVRAICTFGKKISEEQIYHLQEMGIKNIIVFYDDDAVEDIKRMDLGKYFNTVIASTNDADNVRAGDDVGDLSAEQIEQCLHLARKPEEFYFDKVVVYDI